MVLCTIHTQRARPRQTHEIKKERNNGNWVLLLYCASAVPVDVHIQYCAFCILRRGERSWKEVGLKKYVLFHEF